MSIFHKLSLLEQILRFCSQRDKEVSYDEQKWGICSWKEKKRIMTNRKGLFVRGKNVKKERCKGGICKERKDDELVKNC